jgi:EpsI family protein
MHNRRISAPFVITVTMLIGTLLLAGMTNRRIREPLAVPLDQIDAQLAGWQAVNDRPLDAPSLKQLKLSSYLSRTYRKDNAQLDLFIAYYEQQRAGESMHSPKHCLPGSGWEIWKHDSAMVPVNGTGVEINKYSIENLGTRMLMFYWYQSRSRIVASEYTAKVLLARDTILTGRTAGAIVRITVPDTAGADKEGIAFATELIPCVQRCFGSDRR